MAEAEKPAAEGETPKGGKKKLIIIGGAVGAVVLIGVLAMVFMGGGKKGEEGAHGAEAAHEEIDKPKEYLTVEMPTVIVNLSDPSSFLKVTMQLEYDPEALHRASSHGAGHGEEAGGGGGGHGEAKGGGGLPGKLGQREAMIKDSIIRVISSRKAEDLLGVEGKDKLKEDLIDAINEASGLEEPVIVGVYMTEFLIQ